MHAEGECAGIPPLNGKERKNMGQKRKKRVAVVQCAGGCRAEADVPRKERTGDCREMAESSPEGMCK